MLWYPRRGATETTVPRPLHVAGPPRGAHSAHIEAGLPGGGLATGTALWGWRLVRLSTIIEKQPANR